MGRILLYTTVGCGLSSQARVIVQSWGVSFYEICLTEHPDRAQEVADLCGGTMGVPILLLNSDIYKVKEVLGFSLFFFLFSFFLFFLFSFLLGPPSED
jgi:hypothetical protein